MAYTQYTRLGFTRFSFAPTSPLVFSASLEVMHFACFYQLENFKMLVWLQLEYKKGIGAHSFWSVRTHWIFKELKKHVQIHCTPCESTRCSGNYSHSNSRYLATPSVLGDLPLAVWGRRFSNPVPDHLIKLVFSRTLCFRTDVLLSSGS